MNLYFFLFAIVIDFMFYLTFDIIIRYVVFILYYENYNNIMRKRSNQIPINVRPDRLKNQLPNVGNHKNTTRIPQKHNGAGNRPRQTLIGKPVNINGAFTASSKKNKDINEFYKQRRRYPMNVAIGKNDDSKLNNNIVNKSQLQNELDMMTGESIAYGSDKYKYYGRDNKRRKPAVKRGITKEKFNNRVLTDIYNRTKLNNKLSQQEAYMYWQANTDDDKIFIKSRKSGGNIAKPKLGLSGITLPWGHKFNERLQDNMNADDVRRSDRKEDIQRQNIMAKYTAGRPIPDHNMNRQKMIIKHQYSNMYRNAKYEQEYGYEHGNGHEGYVNSGKPKESMTRGSSFIRKFNTRVYELLTNEKIGSESYKSTNKNMNYDKRRNKVKSIPTHMKRRQVAESYDNIASGQYNKTIAKNTTDIQANQRYANKTDQSIIDKSNQQRETFAYKLNKRVYNVLTDVFQPGLNEKYSQSYRYIETANDKTKLKKSLRGLHSGVRHNKLKYKRVDKSYHPPLHSEPLTVATEIVSRHKKYVKENTIQRTKLSTKPNVRNLNTEQYKDMDSLHNVGTKIKRFPSKSEYRHRKYK